MDGVHVEGEVVDFQVGLGREAIQVVVVERLHQLFVCKVSRQIEVGASVEFDIFGQESLDVRQRHITLHFEFQPDVAQQIVHHAIGGEATTIEFGTDTIDGQAVDIGVEVQVQIAIQIDFGKRIRQLLHVDFQIVGQHLSLDQRHEAVIESAFHLDIGEGRLARILDTTQLLLHLLRQVGQHIFDNQRIGIQCQIKVDIVVFRNSHITVHIYNIAVQAYLSLLKMSLHVVQAEQHRQVQTKRVMLKVRFVQIETDVGGSQFQRAVDLVILCHLAVKAKIQGIQCQLDSLHFQGQIFSIQTQIGINVLVLHFAFQVQIESTGMCRHLIAVVGIDQVCVFQLHLLDIHQIIEGGLGGIVVLFRLEDIEIVVAKRIKIQVDKGIF